MAAWASPAVARRNCWAGPAGVSRASRSTVSARRLTVPPPSCEAAQASAARRTHRARSIDLPPASPGRMTDHRPAAVSARPISHTTRETSSDRRTKHEAPTGSRSRATKYGRRESRAAWWRPASCCFSASPARSSNWRVPLMGERPDTSGSLPLPSPVIRLPVSWGVRRWLVAPLNVAGAGTLLRLWWYSNGG